jgi:hypothetical protein
MSGPVYRVKNAMAAASDAKLSNRAWRLFVALATYTNREGKCFPSRVELEVRTGQGVSQQKRATAELVKAGLLVVDVRPPRSNRYQLDPLALSTDRGHTAPGTDVRTGATQPPSPGPHGAGDRGHTAPWKESLKGHRRAPHPYPCACTDCVAFIEERRG